MAGKDEKDQGDGPGKPGETRPPGKKLDRRDVLLGLSTVPALGLFGYAWRKQHAYEQKPKEAAAAARAAAPRTSPRSTSPFSAPSPGAGADRRHAEDPRPALPGGLRHLDGVQPEEGA